jgi:hypothetical protein
MAVSQAMLQPTAALEETSPSSDLRTDARFAGIGLLVTVASLVILYGGSGAIAGTRPDTTTSPDEVRAFFGHGQLTFLLWQAVASGAGICFFALAYRRYLAAFATRPLVRQLADFGVALALIEVPVVFVEFGMQLGIVRLAELGDASILGVFMAWTWIDNGTMLWLEFGWLAALSIAAWSSGALPRPLAAFGLVVAVLLLLVAVPALILEYPLGLSLVAYGPFILWFLVTGVYLVRGGRVNTGRP